MAHLRSQGKVILLGAGPGDPELITQKGAAFLRKADVVLHDALIHPELLKLCNKNATIVHVGKRAKRKSERQSAINLRMAKEAEKGQLVVRLKGGDPYLFGRGSEEAEFLHDHHIPFEVIPGVPSPVAATAYAGISLTHRHLASSVAYITATESPDKCSSAHDWSKLATATQTLIIFMGLGKIDQLMKLLMEHGRDAQTPVAVISQATLPTQHSVIGTVGTIAALVETERLAPPAIIIVGQVVALRPKLRWYDRQALFGLRILVTRPAHQSSGLRQQLLSLGAQPIALPAIRLQPQLETAQQLIAVGNPFDWIVFTSVNGVEYFFEALRLSNKDARWFSNSHVCAIGPATAQALEKHGIVCDLVPPTYQAEFIVEQLQKHQSIQGKHFFLPRAAAARKILRELLESQGATVVDLPIYHTVADPNIKSIQTLMKTETIDAITFTSSSTVRQLLENLADKSLLQGKVLACIGPITADTLRQYGLQPDIVAEEFTTNGLVKAMESYYTKSRAQLESSP